MTLEPLATDFDEDQPSADDAVEEAERSAARRRRGRNVLLGAALFVLLAAAAQLVGPCLKPLGLEEGPLVQQTSENSALVVWFTSHSVDCSLSYVDASGKRVEAAVEQSGPRHRAALLNLKPASDVSYQIDVRGKLYDAVLRTNLSSGTPFRFVVFGDSGQATQAQYTLARRMVDAQPDFVVHTGDLIYPRGERWRYSERFFQPYAALLSRVSFWPSLGNHDVSKENHVTAYREVFDLPANGPANQPPEDNYWFTYADATFLVLNSNLEEPALAADVVPWVEQTLAASNTRWKFAVFHHPAYTCGKYAPTDRILSTVVPAFERGGIDIVFSGHDHMYERSHPLRAGQVVASDAGIVYVVSGAGGAELYDVRQPDPNPTWLAARHTDTHSYSHVSIDGGALAFQQIGLNGHVLDEWSIEKR